MKFLNNFDPLGGLKNGFRAGNKKVKQGQFMMMMQAKPMVDNWIKSSRLACNAIISRDYSKKDAETFRNNFLRKNMVVNLKIDDVFRSNMERLVGNIEENKVGADDIDLVTGKVLPEIETFESTWVSQGMNIFHIKKEDLID